MSDDKAWIDVCILPDPIPGDYHASASVYGAANYMQAKIKHEHSVAAALYEQLQIACSNETWNADDGLRVLENVKASGWAP